jgi:hypothetical protein
MNAHRGDAENPQQNDLLCLIHPFFIFGQVLMSQASIHVDTYTTERWQRHLMQCLAPSMTKEKKKRICIEGK